jgi:hypothetical protein
MRQARQGKQDSQGTADEVFGVKGHGVVSEVEAFEIVASSLAFSKSGLP